jgi:hypothetical protein
VSFQRDFEFGIDRFYRVLERTKHAKTRQEAGRGGNEKDAGFADYFAKVSRELSDLRKDRAMIQQDPGISPKEKREQMDEYDKYMADLAREVLAEYDGYEDEAGNW